MNKPSPYAVTCLGTSSPDGPQCNDGKLIFLTEEEYLLQLERQDDKWRCPICGGLATWDDDNYDEWANRE